jgi:hypothetical protein
MSFFSSLVAKFKAFVKGPAEPVADSVPVTPAATFAELLEYAEARERVAIPPIEPAQEAEVAVRRAPRKRKPKAEVAAPAPAPAKKKPAAKKTPEKVTAGAARPPRKTPAKKAK